MFRSLDTRTKLGQAFLEYSSRGELVPAEITVELWQVQIQHTVEAHRFKPDLDYLVLDGIPRSVEQARVMKSLHRRKEGVPSRLPEPRGTRRPPQKARLKDNRLDDANESVIHQRLDIYEPGKQARAGILWPGPRADH